MTLTLSFHGAAGTVTGSRHLLTNDGTSILVDCGLFQGLKELRLRNWLAPPFDPRQLRAVLLTHAHIDHSGYLPRLVRGGFRGPIYCTPATRDLARIMLIDAARLQEEDAEFANRKGFSKHRPALPLFDEHDAREAFALFVSANFDTPKAAGPFQFTFHPAGHILGSAFVEVRTRVGRTETATVFSGDLGRSNAPLHADPEPIPACDTLVLESTYGDHLHPRGQPGRGLAAAIEPTLRSGGTVLIPSFAVARAQVVALVLRRLIDAGELPDVPVHVDSPMAADVTEVYTRYAGARDLDAIGRGRTLFPRQVRFHDSPAESRSLNDLPGPRIIISSSGMLSGGRVLHHFKRLAPDPRNLVLLVGYQAEGTRGRDLQEGARSLRMHGEDVPVGARVTTLDGFSAHADADQLMAWAFGGLQPPETVFLVHGEREAVGALAMRVRDRHVTATVPYLGATYEFLPGPRRWRQR